MKVEYQTFLIVLIYFCIISYSNEWFAVNQPNYYKKSKPLKDLGFNVFPKINPSIANYMLYLTVAYFFARFIFKDISVLTSFLFIMSIIFTMRIFCFNVTHMPFTWKNCENKEKWQRTFMFIYDTDSCGDYMFSGHASYYALIVLFFLYFSKNMNEKILVTIYSILGTIAVIAGRLHYSRCFCCTFHYNIIILYISLFLFNPSFFKTLKLCSVHK